MKKIYFIVIIILVSICLLYALPYFIVFHNGISENSVDFGNWGSFIGGLSTIFSAITIFILITNEIKAKKENLSIKNRENIRFLLDNMIPLGKMKINAAQYCEIAINGSISEQDQKLSKDHEISVNELKEYLLYIYSLIQDDSIPQVEKSIYRWKLFEAFSDDERQLFIKYFNNESVTWLLDKKVYYGWGLY
jgi:uncharacterized protein YqfB (UPF0267 family)